MDYSKIYRKGETMNLKKIKKGKKSIDNKKDAKVYEKYACYVVGLLILLLIISFIKNPIFLPALLITIALELFCIAYYFIDNKNKKKLVYELFIFGVALVLFAVIYTIIKIA